MDFGLDPGLAHIQSKLSDSLKELADKGNKLTDLENQLKEGHEKLDLGREQLEEERKRIVEKEEELQKEKKLMETYAVEEDDVVELNVQGEIMMTLRKTLIQVWSSEARAMIMHQCETVTSNLLEPREYWLKWSFSLQKLSHQSWLCIRAPCGSLSNVSLYRCMCC